MRSIVSQSHKGAPAISALAELDTVAYLLHKEKE